MGQGNHGGHADSEQGARGARPSSPEHGGPAQGTVPPSFYSRREWAKLVTLARDNGVAVHDDESFGPACCVTAPVRTPSGRPARRRHGQREPREG
ncbi:hypothetical protein [Herbihabitans rhizosphaerae]|uniref:hypothetical protein n=1 Tax=Herbihabitans rhizosphaerae TaxID=1872711 RepID=UPI00102B4087|nr:hypothetical protein [Herbihabitans rhizosphaerae]